ncbi:MAG: hypothetical protein GC203_18495 [Phenylobacterium sp.]|uniref:hypothetical protein n=1 Tax=Phenylobacterium sp. TaxID=1871053 RepID=UPI0025DBF793|nr:hypothetical protein [Phenylobacterium sp.]MBI1199853.1 hypothetical protein [Phenylobacterium sp.]
MTATPQAGSLADSLGLVAQEVADLTVLADHLQGVISRMAAAAAPDRTLMVDAQAADLLHQRLQGLASFMNALAIAAPVGAAHGVAGALRGLSLSEQARRLAGHAPAAPEGSGELTTFWD